MPPFHSLAAYKPDASLNTPVYPVGLAGPRLAVSVVVRSGGGGGGAARVALAVEPGAGAAMGAGVGAGAGAFAGEGATEPSTGAGDCVGAVDTALGRDGPPLGSALAAAGARADVGRAGWSEAACTAAPALDGSESSMSMMLGGPSVGWGGMGWHVGWGGVGMGMEWCWWLRRPNARATVADTGWWAALGSRRTVYLRAPRQGASG